MLKPMTRVKICGIRTLPDALAAIEAGADLLGFNFYPKSARFIQVQTCAGIAVALKQLHPAIQLTGVFVNAPLEAVQEIRQTCKLDLVQLHGDESQAFCTAVGNGAFKAFRGVPDGELDSYARKQAPAFLLDAHVTGFFGGTGVPADWQAAASLAQLYPLLLAGGLNPENVAEAIQLVRPWGVDVASGVEIRPGDKDSGRMKAFVAAVRSVQVKVEP